MHVMYFHHGGAVFRGKIVVSKKITISPFIPFLTLIILFSSLPNIIFSPFFFSIFIFEIEKKNPQILLCEICGLNQREGVEQLKSPVLHLISVFSSLTSIYFVRVGMFIQTLENDKVDHHW